MRIPALPIVERNRGERPWPPSGVAAGSRERGAKSTITGGLSAHTVDCEFIGPVRFACRRKLTRYLQPCDLSS